MTKQFVQPWAVRSYSHIYNCLLNAQENDGKNSNYFKEENPALKKKKIITMCRLFATGIWFTHQGAFSRMAAVLTDTMSLPKTAGPHEAQLTYPERRLYCSIKTYPSTCRSRGDVRVIYIFNFCLCSVLCRLQDEILPEIPVADSKA